MGLGWLSNILYKIFKLGSSKVNNFLCDQGNDFPLSFSFQEHQRMPKTADNNHLLLLLKYHLCIMFFPIQTCL